MSESETGGDEVSVKLTGEHTTTLVDGVPADLSIDYDTDYAALVADLGDDEWTAIRISPENAAEVGKVLQQYAEHMKVGTLEEDASYHEPIGGAGER